VTGRTAGVLVPVVVLGLLASGCGGGTVGQQRDDPAASVGTPGPGRLPKLDACPAAAPGPRAELPAVRLRCLGPGPALALDRLPARLYVINLWASWCLPCRLEAPRLRAAAAATRGHVQFLGIDSQDERGSALDFLAYVGVGYPQLADPNAGTLHRLGAPGLPVTLAVDADGRIVYRRIGEISTAQLAAAVHAADPTARLPAGAGR